jgi:hypothetical protein
MTNEAVELQKHIQGAARILYKGDISDERSPFYATLLLPIAVIKKSINWIREFLQKLIWNELMQDSKRQESNTVQDIINIIIFIVFCIVCIATYRLHDYYSYILVFVGFCWYIDKVLAQRIYANRRILVTLTHTKDQWCLWEMQSASKIAKHQKFHDRNLVGVSIARIKIYSPAFSVVIAKTWRVYLKLQDGSFLPIYEERKTKLVLDKAREIAKYFKVSTDLISEQQISFPLVTSSRASKVKNFKYTHGAIAIQKTDQRWHIYSQWSMNSIWNFLGKVISESGFLLFVLFLSEFMWRFGEMLDQIISTYRTTEVITFDLSNIFSVYSFSWKDGLSLAIAIGIIWFRAVKVSQIKHLYLDQHKLKFKIDRRAIAELNLAEIDYAALIKTPESMILVSDQHNVIEIKNLFTEQDYESMLHHLQDGLTNFSNLKNLEVQSSVTKVWN